MAFSRSPAFSYAEESYSPSVDYDDTMAWFISDTDSSMPRYGVSPPAPAPSWDIDATIDPALLLTQYQNGGNFPNDAAPIQQS
jgi:hypothetical protein